MIMYFIRPSLFVQNDKKKVWKYVTVTKLLRRNEWKKIKHMNVNKEKRTNKNEHEKQADKH